MATSDHTPFALAVISVPPDPCHDSRVHPQRCSIDIKRSWALVMLMEVVFIFLSLFRSSFKLAAHAGDIKQINSADYSENIWQCFWNVSKKGIKFPILCVFDFRPEVPDSSVYRFVFGAMHIVLLFFFPKAANQLARVL